MTYYRISQEDEEGREVIIYAGYNYNDAMNALDAKTGLCTACGNCQHDHAGWAHPFTPPTEGAS
jgi:hypothetical protein